MPSKAVAMGFNVHGTHHEFLFTIDYSALPSAKSMQTFNIEGKVSHAIYSMSIVILESLTEGMRRDWIIKLSISGLSDWGSKLLIVT